MANTTNLKVDNTPGKLDGYLIWFVAVILYLAPMYKLAWEVGIRVWPLDLVVLVSASLVAGAVCLGYRPRLRFIDVSVLFLVVSVSMLSFLVARDVTMSLKLFVSLLRNIILALLIVIAGRTSFLFKRLLVHWVGSALVTSLYGLVQWFLLVTSTTNLDLLWMPAIGMNPRTSGPPALTAGIYRITSLALDPNNFSSFLLLVSVPLLAWWLYATFFSRGKRTYRWPLLIALGFVTFVNIMTISRSGLGGLALGGAIVLLAFWRQFLLVRYTENRGWYVDRRLLWLVTSVAFIGIVIAITIIMPNWADISRTIAVRSKPLMQAGGIFAEPMRLMLSKASFSMLARSPLLGVGLGNFATVLEQDYYPELTGWGAHNGYLDIMASTGILGVFAYAALFALLGWRLLRLYMAKTGFYSYVVGLGFFGALVGFMGANVFYQSFQYMYFWAFVGLALAGTRVAKQQPVDQHLYDAETHTT